VMNGTGALRQFVPRSLGIAPGRPLAFASARLLTIRDAEILRLHREGESDVVNTYRLCLRYELFRGRLTDAEFHASEVSLIKFVETRGNTKPQLSGRMKVGSGCPTGYSGYSAVELSSYLQVFDCKSVRSGLLIKPVERRP
jgi:Predicted 3'-5' exonuclease related to the exonuclease domain of PolB